MCIDQCIDIYVSRHNTWIKSCGFLFILFLLQGWTRGVRYDDFWSCMIKMSPQSAFEEILLYRATAHIPDSKHCWPRSRPTSGPHGFHTGQMWAGSGPKLCCCLGFYQLQFWRRPPYQYTVQRHIHSHQCEISSRVTLTRHWTYSQSQKYIISQLIISFTRCAISERHVNLKRTN